LAEATFFALLAFVDFAAAFFEFGVNRKLGLAQTHRFLRGFQIDTVDLEQDAARLDFGHPEFRRALTRTHADFGGLLGHRHIREYADPNAAGTLHVTGDGAARGFDFARVQAFRLQGLEAIGAEVQRGARLGRTVDAALVLLAEFCALG
jgi:hypothetical protein